MKQKTLAFKEQVQSELLVVGGRPCACIYAQMLFTNKLGLVFQNDLAPDFGVFGFVNLTNISKVVNSPKKLSIPLNLTLWSQLHSSSLQQGPRNMVFNLLWKGQEERAHCSWQIETDILWVCVCTHVHFSLRKYRYVTCLETFFENSIAKQATMGNVKQFPPPFFSFGLSDS